MADTGARHGADAPARPPRDVVVVVGVGGMGESIARRLGPGRAVLLADLDGAALDGVATALRGDGFDVTPHPVDVSSRASVAALAAAAARVGPVTQVVHTAGVSPIQASRSSILAVDLVGVALVLEEFGTVIAPGGTGVVIASMAAHGVTLRPEEEQELATTAPEGLTGLAVVRAAEDPGAAYGLAKRANQLRVQAASVTWGARGARVNSVSPGVISTPMGRQELDGVHGATMRAMVAASGAGRLGTPSDITDAVAFLVGPTSGFVTGTDLLVDGGAMAARRAF